MPGDLASHGRPRQRDRHERRGDPVIEAWHGPVITPAWVIAAHPQRLVVTTLHRVRRQRR